MIIVTCLKYVTAFLDNTHLHLVSDSWPPDRRIGSNASTEHCHFYACPTENDNSLFKEVNGSRHKKVLAKEI